eukprot:1631249-Pleurochrysis_carterae.AAC.2
MGATASRSPMNMPSCAMRYERTTARRGSSPAVAPAAKKRTNGKRLSRAMACRMRAEPNMEPSAVERHAAVTPNTTKYCAAGSEGRESQWVGRRRRWRARACQPAHHLY